MERSGLAGEDDMAGRPEDISARALSIGRIIDRLCRAPGTYIITLVIPTHRRAPWLIEFHRLEKLRSVDL